MSSERVILHADMDAFYASIEQRDHPELRGKPVIVGASSARGVVAAASYEARQFGVRSAMPGFRARELCPNGVFVRSDMALYARVSDELHEIFGQFSSEIEPIALDEAFLDVTGSVHLFGSALELGRTLRARVRELTQLPISVGIASSKLVAKIACGLSKPDGLLVVPAEAVTWLLFPLPVRRIWGVGPVLEQTLIGLGISTIGELAAFDGDALAQAIGDRAYALQRLAHGVDERRVEGHLAPKSCGEENTFERDVSDRTVVSATLTAHAEAVARRLRAMGYLGRTVTLKIKLGRARGDRAPRVNGERGEPVYPLLSRSKTLGQPTNDGTVIRDVAVALWDAAKIDEPVRLLGVSLSNLEATQAAQLELFAPEDRSARLGSTLDRITSRFGKGAIRRAVDEPEKATATDKRKRGE